MSVTACVMAAITAIAAEQLSESDSAKKIANQPPPPRARSEVERAFGKSITGGTSANEKVGGPTLRQLNVVFLDAKKDHGPGEHDYPAWKKKWTELFRKMPKVSVDTAYEWPTDAQLEKANLLVCYYWNHDWSPTRYKSLDSYLKRGGGLVMLHSSVIADRAAEQLAGRIGLAFQPDRMKYRHGELEIKIEEPDHSLMRGLPRLIRFHDESYWPPLGDVEQVHVLATTVEEEKSWPMIWTFEPDKENGGKGRVFCSVLGHYSWTFDDPLFRLMILRGAGWCAGEPQGRFERLAIEGIKLRDQ